MGIDSQGSNRGKCSCGECVEFVRGSGVLCGYCECVPVRHEKVTDPGGALGYFLGGYVPFGTPNWHPVLEKNSPKIDTPF